MANRKESNPFSQSSQSSPSAQSIQKKTDDAPVVVKGAKTLLRIKYDAGFPNSLFIRGKGGGLSWDKGIQLKNVKADEWIWETNNLSNDCEYKILINDRVYETGENHHLRPGSISQITPRF